MLVLLIDDSDTFRSRMRRRLEDEPGFTVLEAGNGLEGLNAIEQSSPDAVLLDLQMHDLDGLTLLAEIRARFGGLKVIVVSANLSAAARTRCEDLGADAMVDKADAASDVVPLLRGASPARLENA